MYVSCDRIAGHYDGKRKREQIMVLNTRLENTVLFNSLGDKRLQRILRKGI